jgi:cell division protein FtsN
MRDQHDQAEEIEQSEETETTDETADESDETPKTKTKKTRTRKAATAKPAKEKAPAKPRARKKAVKVPPRVFARWAVCDNGMKRIALFEYKDRAIADAKLIEMKERKPGTFFIVLVKEAYVPPEPEPVATV